MNLQISKHSQQLMQKQMRINSLKKHVYKNKIVKIV